MARVTYYFDVDGVLANFHKEKFNYKNAISREWIANLEPFIENVNLVKELLANKKSVYIITKAASEQAKLGKLDWFKKYIPELEPKRIIVIVGNGNKANFMKTKNGILIDDDMKNCKQWAKAGQKFIHLEVKGMKIEL